LLLRGFLKAEYFITFEELAMDINTATTAAALAVGIVLQTPAFAAPNGVNLTIVGSGAITKSAVTKPPIGAIKGGTVSVAPTTGELPGQVAILTGGWVSARDGGHHSIDALTTSATSIGPNERFTVEKIGPDYTLFKTRGGYYVSAAGGGGWTPANSDTQTMQTERTSPASDALFSVHSINGALSNPFTIQTYYGYYLTAENGGGKSTSAFRSDATTAATTYEWFSFFHCGDLGDGYDYAIVAPLQGTLGAAYGGGLVKNALNLYGGKFKFIRQDDGSYALQTSNGVNYVTAINGGGLAHGTATTDNLVTDRTQIQAWEKFRIVDQGNCNYTIQTSSGYFVAFAAPGNGNGSFFSTDISDPAAAPSIDYSAYFLITPVWP
jgi:hypothetical protein